MEKPIATYTGMPGTPPGTWSLGVELAANYPVAAGFGTLPFDTCSPPVSPVGGNIDQSTLEGRASGVLEDDGVDGAGRHAPAETVGTGTIAEHHGILIGDDASLPPVAAATEMPIGNGLDAFQGGDAHHAQIGTDHVGGSAGGPDDGHSSVIVGALLAIEPSFIDAVPPSDVRAESANHDHASGFEVFAAVAGAPAGSEPHHGDGHPGVVAGSMPFESWSDLLLGHARPLDLVGAHPDLDLSRLGALGGPNQHATGATVATVDGSPGAVAQGNAGGTAGAGDPATAPPPAEGRAPDPHGVESPQPPQNSSNEGANGAPNPGYVSSGAWFTDAAIKMVGLEHHVDHAVLLP